jgi:hypothetical protein
MIAHLQRRTWSNTLEIVSLAQSFQQQQHFSRTALAQNANSALQPDSR